MSELKTVSQNKIVRIGIATIGISLLGSLLLPIFEATVGFFQGINKIFFIFACIGIILCNIGLEISGIKWKNRYATLGIAVCVPWTYLIFVPAIQSNMVLTYFLMWGIFVIEILSLLFTTTFRKSNTW